MVYVAAEWYGAGLVTAGSWFRNRIPPVAAVYQCQLSVPTLWGRLMSTSENWAYYVMHCPRISGLAALAGVQLRAKETDQRCPMGLKARKKTLLF